MQRGAVGGIALAGEQRLHQRGNRRERIVDFMRDSGGESSGGRQALGLQQLVHHFAAMRDVAENHMDEALIAISDQRGILIEEEWTERQVKHLTGAVSNHLAEMLNGAGAAFLEYEIRDRAADQ